MPNYQWLMPSIMIIPMNYRRKKEKGGGGGITTVTKLEGDIPLGLLAMLALVITMNMIEREKL